MEEQQQKKRVHVVIIPFPAPSHTTPLLDLTVRLLRHDNNLIATVVVTPSTSSLLQPLLSIFPPRLHPLILSPPSSVDSPRPPTCRVRALHSLSDPIISWCGSHPHPPSVIISDFFCFWTHKVSSCLNVPRVVFYPSGAFGSAVMYSTWRLSPKNIGEEVVLDDVDGSPRFKWSELSNLFRCGQPGDPHWDIFRDELLSNLTSWGAVFNTFSELEKVHLHHFKKEMGHNRVWAVGPLLQDDVAVDQSGGSQLQEVMTWLDGKPDCSVVYICFGSRTALTAEESAVLRAALELSKVHFILCLRESDGGEGTSIKPGDYECDPKTAADNGFIIKGWAPQLAILKHRALGGFLTHCGWNSVIEAICSGAVMVCWPMGADQYSNAQLVVDRLGLGFRVKCNGSNGIPDPQELARLLVECVCVTRQERGRVMSLRKVAASTLKSGGASALDFDQFVECLSKCAE